MKQINHWHDLQPYGVNALTGEACMLGTRALCDLNQDGINHVKEFLGLPYNATFQESWNSHVDGKEALGSMFLPWSMLADLAAFLLIKSGCTRAFSTEMGIFGIEITDDQGLVNEFEVTCSIKRHYRPLHGHPCQGLSSVHAMTGRSQ